MRIEIQVFHVRVGRLERVFDADRRGARRRVEDVVEVVARDRGADELDGDGIAGRRVACRVRGNITGPAGVDVAGKEDSVFDGVVAQVPDHAAAVGFVAVPLVDVVRHTIDRGAAHELSYSGRFRGAQRGGEAHRGDHHGVAHELPLRPGGFKVAQQPVHLRGARDGAGGAADGGIRAVGGLLVTVGAQVQHGQAGQGAEIEAAVDPAARFVADGHPFRVGPVRGREALAPQTFVARGVVLGAALPGVVGGFVVVPGHDERGRSVQGLQVAVGLVLGVAAAVVRQLGHLEGRIVRADHHVARLVLPRGVLVEVVAQVKHGVEVSAGGEVAVGGEVAGLPVGAGHDAELQAFDGGPGGGAVRVRPAGETSWPKVKRYQ